MSRLALLTLPLLLATTAHATPATYTLDAHHTNVVWHVTHFGFSHPSGHFAMIGGTLVYDEANPQNSSVKATIDVTGLATGMDDFNTHIKSADFLDAAKFPTATFISTKVIPHDATHATVQGTLSLHGLTAPLALEVTLNKSGVSPMTKKPTLGFTATGTLKRSTFKVDKYAPDVSDDVRLDIEAEAN